MSRCFAFPPPGYEGKPRSEHKDLLKKEKHKVKKHRKERTDGGKREGKEKDRDHRKDKRNKKHKREKHEDRRKRKERDKEKREIWEQETHKYDNLDNRRPKQIVHNEAVKNSKHRDKLASQITGQEVHANNIGNYIGKLLPRSVESFGLVGCEKYVENGQHNHASEKEKDKTTVLNGMNLQVGPAENCSTRSHGRNGVGLEQESSKCVLTTSAATKQKRGIKLSTNASQGCEQVDQHSDGSSHFAYGKSDRMSTNMMAQKKNESTNNFHSRTDKQLVRGENGTAQGNANINKDVKVKHQKGVKDADRAHGVNHKAVKDRDEDHNVKKRKAKDGIEGKVRANRSIGHEQKHKELAGHEMDSAHFNGNKFTSDDVKKRKDLNTKSYLHEHIMQMAKMPRTSPANHLPAKEHNSSVFSTSYGRSEAGAGTRVFMGMQEKHKVKKHRKERTDGGKREGKEKDRDHRKDKRNKKHKREKHEDRRKRKERDKEKREIWEQETHKYDNLDNRRPKQIVHNEVVKNSKHRDKLASQITGQEVHANNIGNYIGKLLPRSVESFGLVGCEKYVQNGQHNHASEKEKDKTTVLNSMNLQVGPAENCSTRSHGRNGVGLEQESSKCVLTTSAATKQKHGIKLSTNASQGCEQVDQHSDGSSHFAYGKSDRMSTNMMAQKKNESTNNFHSRMDKQLVRGENGTAQGNAKINKDVKVKHQKSVKDADRAHGVNHKAVKDRDEDHNVKKRKAKDGIEGKVRANRSIGHEQKHKELAGHEMDSAHFNGNKFTSDDVKKRKDLNTKIYLHEHIMQMAKMPRTSPANHLPAKEHNSSVFSTSYGRSEAGAGTRVFMGMQVNTQKI